MRGFYRVNQPAWPIVEDGEELTVPDAIVLAITTRWVYLYTAKAPHSWLEEHVPKKDLDLLGYTWVEAWNAIPKKTRERIFLASIERETWDNDTERRAVARRKIPLSEVDPETDTVFASPLVPVRWGTREGRKEQTALTAVVSG